MRKGRRGCERSGGEDERKGKGRRGCEEGKDVRKGRRGCEEGKERM